MFKNLKLKNKLLLSYFIVTFFSILLVTIFNSVYFSNRISSMAAGDMEKNRGVSQTIYNSKLSEIEKFAQSLANDPVIKIYSTLSRSVAQKKMSPYLNSILNQEQIYYATVLNSGGQRVTDQSIPDLSFSKSVAEGIDYSKNSLFITALGGRFITTTELIKVKKDDNILSITSVVPIINDNKVTGVIFIRHILNDHKSLFNSINELLQVRTAVYQEQKVIKGDNRYKMTEKEYQGILNSEGIPEGKIDISFNGILAEFIPLLDHKGNSVGLLAIFRSPQEYVDTIIQSIIYSLIFMLLCMLGATGMGFLVARSISVPIQNLVKEVNMITSGDLTHEIASNLKDEIGKLSESFNEMRVTLKEKLTTIEQMNFGLEDTIKKRTKTIQALLFKMKKYLSPQLYDSIAGGTRDERLTHQRKKLTVFFSDIKGFTKTTDTLEPEELSALLNQYLDEMASIAIKWGGTIDKFIGDAIMIFFGDPEFIDDRTHALRAVKMAIEMLERLSELREEWRENGITHPLHIRVGINSGYCTVGNFGSENRMDYTIIGGQVNAASRLETAADTDSILISGETYLFIKDEIKCQYKGDLQVKGIHAPIKTYEVVGYKDHKRLVDKYFRKSRRGLEMKRLVLDRENITDEEKELQIKALKIALHLLKKDKNVNPDEVMLDGPEVEEPEEGGSESLNGDSN